jgi:hypothetical protein
MARSIIWEPSWEADIDHLRAGKKAPAPIDEVIESIEFVLSNIADDYPGVGTTDFRVLLIRTARGLPELEAWFRIEEDDSIHCYRVIPVERAEEEDDGVGEY